MSFEVDRPIQLLGAASSELIKDDIGHALATTNAISSSDLSHANAASPTYSIGSSSLSSQGGIAGYSDKPRAEDSRNNVARTYSQSPRQPCDSNRHLLSPVPDCLDSEAAAAHAAAAAAAAVAAAVNSGGEAPVRVPLPTPPASDGTPPQRQWHDSIRRAPTVAMDGIRPMFYAASSSASWPSSSVASTASAAADHAGANYPAPGFIGSYSASSSIMPPASHQTDAIYHELIHPPHVAWLNTQQQQQHHHHHQSPFRSHHPPSYGPPAYSDPFGHSPIPSSSYHHHHHHPYEQPRRPAYHHPYHHHHHSQTQHHQQQQQQQQQQPPPPPQLQEKQAAASSPDTVSSSSSSSNLADSKVVTTTPRRYKCTVCVKRFTRPSSLATHMHSHTGEKPYKCQIDGCGRRFSVVSNLRRHAKIHSNKSS